MKPITRKPLLLLGCASFWLNTACTTLRPIEAEEPAGYVENIEVGDTVRLLYLDERVKEVEVLELNEMEITGKADGGGIVIADWRDIYQVEQVRISPVKTAGAAVGIIIAIPVVVAMAVVSGCATTYC